MVEEAKLAAAPVRWAFLGLGFGFVGLGTVGAVVPVMPSTIFFILALWAFKRSSPRFELWLLTHPVVGATLRDWDEHRAIRRRTKVVAVSLLWACLLLSALFVTKPYVWGILGATGVLVSWYILSRRTREMI
jgi:hypothetical protein